MYQTNTKKYRSSENCRSKYSSKLRSNLKRFDKNLPLDFTRSYLEDRISRSDSRWIGLIRRERWKRVERDRVKSTGERGARQFRGNSRQKLARVRESSCWEAEPKIEKQELPLHCTVSKQPDPGKEERSSSHPLPTAPSYRPLDGRRKGVTINRTNSGTGPE